MPSAKNAKDYDGLAMAYDVAGQVTNTYSKNGQGNTVITRSDGCVITFKYINPSDPTQGETIDTVTKNSQPASISSLT
jgi:hypothetical protein